MDPKDRIIVPIDISDIDKAIKLVTTLKPYVGMFKFGLELITTLLVQLVITGDILLLQKVQTLFKAVEGQLFWDGKWDDISNTVGNTALALSPLNPKMVNVHASAGIDSMQAAVQNSSGSLVLGVTVLTSIKEGECISIFGDLPNKKVVEFARTIFNVGAQEIICSAKELYVLEKEHFANNLLKVVPGIRPQWAPIGDQKRVMTPSEAINVGADYLVIGRPITELPIEVGGPIEAVRRIIDEIGGIC